MKKPSILISDEYRAINNDLHSKKTNYGNNNNYLANQLPPIIRLLHKTHAYNSVLDYGCGKGVILDALKKELINEKIDLIGYDPCIEKYCSPPSASDILLCTDVLEHIEKEYIHNVLDHIRSLTGKICYLTIDLMPAEKNLPDGRNAHILLEEPGWWLNLLSERFKFGVHIINEKSITSIDGKRKRKLKN